MGLNILSILGSSDRTRALAERVSGRSRQQVWQRIEARIRTLDVLQARGYIHARAATILREQFDLLVAQEGAQITANRERIISMASEMLVDSILSSTQPAIQKQSKRAAA